MGLLDDIKNQVKKSGSNKGKIVYFKPGVKVRVRFRQELDKGIKVTFHDSYTLGISVPCQEQFGKECKHCGNDELKEKVYYVWSVYEHESKEDKLIMQAANNCSPVPGLVNFFETYGTIMDRDYVITQNGQGTGKSFGIVPMDKSKFKNDKSKPFSEKKMLDIINKAFPDADAEDDDDEDEDEKPVKKQGKKEDKKGKGKKEEEDEDEGWDDDEEEDADEDEVDYDSMSAKELYTLCKERDIEVPTKKDASFYIKKLKEVDDDLAW